MNWNEIKVDHKKIYPENRITVFMMDTESGKPATHWVDKAYENYEFKKECMFNCYITIDLTDSYNAQKIDHDVTEIEHYFRTNLREVGVCHLIARITTDVGMHIELYVDDVENAINKFNELEEDPHRLVNFDCEISDDEEWVNVSEILIAK